MDTRESVIEHPIRIAWDAAHELEALLVQHDKALAALESIIEWTDELEEAIGPADRILMIRNAARAALPAAKEGC